MKEKGQEYRSGIAPVLREGEKRPGEGKRRGRDERDGGSEAPPAGARAKRPR